MLTNEQLAQMTIKRVIFHDVPNKHDGADGGLLLASAETLVDGARRKLLKTKLTRVLDGKSAYPILFMPNTSSNVPEIVRSYTINDQSDAAFVKSSQDLARQLQLAQNGAVSSGLLCVIDIVTDGKRGLILMKLEREAGAQLKLDTEGGKTRFAMSVLEDLVLTDGTRLFKTAAFLRTDQGNDDFEMSACDSQHRVTDSSDMARFWIKYLGCMLREDPRVATSKFYNATIEFINSVVSEPVKRTEFYDCLHAELRSNKKQITPKLFIQEYVPDELKRTYREFLEERHVSLATFPKDTVDIKSKLTRSTYLSEKGIMISAPVASEELISVTNETIVVQDKLKRVGRG